MTLRPLGSSLLSRSLRCRLEQDPRVVDQNTGLASGWSPADGSSPRSIRKLRTPAAAAPIRSLCEPDAVAVAAGHLQDRLDAFLHQQRSRDQRAHRRPRAGAIGEVDRIGKALERHCLGDELGAVEGDRRRDFGGDDKTLGGELGLKGQFHGLDVAKLCGPGKRKNEKTTKGAAGFAH